MKNKICFLVGSMAISGGTYVIIQHASYLQDQGYDVTLGIQEPFSSETLAWHDLAYKLRCLPIAKAKQEPYDLVVATWWKTVFELKEFDSPRYGYFIQSIESRFYPEAEFPLRTLVDETYRFPLASVTEATWIQRFLADNFGHSATLVRNGIRKDVYSGHGPVMTTRDTVNPRILVEGHFGVPFKNTALAIRLAKEAGFKDIWVLTGSAITWLPGVKRLYSRVPMLETPAIYRSCDILLKLSTVEGMFGPPLEMFHCGGTAVVFDVSGHEEYIIDGVNACVVPKGDVDEVVQILRHLLNDKEYLTHLKNGATETAAAWPDWNRSSMEFYNWVGQTLDDQGVDRRILTDMTERAYSNYQHDEQRRLVRDPTIVRRHKLSALATRLPTSLVRFVKQTEAIGETLIGTREAL